MLLAEILKQPSRLDSLKDPIVLQMESLQYSLFHLIALVIFICAIIHTLSVYKIHAYARRREAKQPTTSEGRSFSVHLLYFLAEVEVVFALWAIPLLLIIWGFYGWRIGFEYFDTRDYTETLFVVVILSMASTRPIVYVAEKIIHWITLALGGSLAAWWFVLLTFGPLLGSLITEAAAMAICALLLSRKFYAFHPSRKLAYATLGLLFVNISIGGVLTDFASPAALILAHAWKWSLSDMFLNFGWKAIIGIVLSNTVYWLYFRKELIHMGLRCKAMGIYHTYTRQPGENPIPLWITLTHILFMVLIVLVSYYPTIFIAIFLFFIGFHQATRPHQHPIQIARPLMVGLFLAGLIIHGGLQGWWVVGILKDLSPLSVMGVAMALTGFNDNAGISYLTTLIPSWGKAYQYAVFTGVVAGGGLTVIANAPNPAGFAILRKHFDQEITPGRLFLAALLPTCILYAIYFLFGPLSPIIY